MFGQTNSPFGSPQGSGGFGATNTAPTFGSPAPAPFGAPASGFGNATPGFGTPAQPSTGFGAATTFGSAAPNTGFGAASGFGAPAPAPTGFGATGGFGSSTATTSPFGAPAAAPSGGLFGSAPAAPSGGLFGSVGTASTGFGAPAPSSGFGATGGFGGTSGFGTQQTSAFGTPAPAPTTGLFGAPAPAPAFGATGGFGSSATGTTAFGSPAPAPSGGGLFGAAPAPSTGLFGAAPAVGQQQAGGTKAIPFQVTNCKQEGATAIAMQSITAMAAYESKSFEELRYEDYMQGNRGSSNGAQAGSSFGFNSAPAPVAGGGLFGSATPAPAPFGTPAPATGFGAAPAPAPFGAPAPVSGAFGAPTAGFGGSTFGAAAPVPFGTPAQAPGAFGAPAPAFGGSAFGAKPATTGLFGAPAPSPGLFGSAAAPAPAFGAPAPATGGLFGAAPAPATGGLFGAPAPASGGLFGAAPTPASTFGAPAAPAVGLFGAPAASAGGIFGAPTPAPAFGAQASPGGLFGAPAPSAGLFGAKPAGAGLFGATAPAPTTGLFGAAAPAPSAGHFGAPAQNLAQQSLALPIGSIIPPATNEVLAHQISALENKRKELEKLDVWRGKSPESSALVPISQPESNTTSLALIPSQQSYSPYRVVPRSTAKIRPRGFQSKSNQYHDVASPLKSIGTVRRPMMSPEAFAASSVKRLYVKPGKLIPKPKLSLTLPDNSGTNSRNDTLAFPFPQERITPPSEQIKGISSPEARMQPAVGNFSLSNSGESMLTAVVPFPSKTDESSNQSAPTVSSLIKHSASEPGFDYFREVIGATDSNPKKFSSVEVRREAIIPSFVPKLTRPGYISTPSVAEMSSFSEADLAALAGFSVERKNFGRVEWEGLVDVRCIDLDIVVEIEQNDVSVYLEDEKQNTKPPVGSKLNRPAFLSFFNVYPKQGPDADDAAKKSFANKIEKSTNKMGAKLISYDSDNGVWKIRVEHFSRYALDDDDDDDQEEEENVALVPFPYGDTSDRKMQKYKIEDAAVVSDVEMNDHNEIKVMMEAENAYEKMFGLMNENVEMESPNKMVISENRKRVAAVFEEEDVIHDSSLFTRAKPSEDDFLQAKCGTSICARIADTYFHSKTSSNTNFGLRMGKSFRVGWSRDGSFIKLMPAGVTRNPSLVRCRPLFNGKVKTNLDDLENHHKHAISSSESECPIYSIPCWVEPEKSRKTASEVALHSTILSYANAMTSNRKISEEDLVLKRAFSFLSCILTDSKTNLEVEDRKSVVSNQDKRIDQGRNEAIRRWFIDACRNDVDKEIEVAKSKNDVYSAIFSALSGGDIEKASIIATDMGRVDLGVLLASGVEGQEDIIEEMQLCLKNGAYSNAELQMLRIYRLLGGDLSEEGKIHQQGRSSLDWRRRLSMILSYDTFAGCLGNNLSDTLEKYRSNVAKGTAPYPHPRYLSLSRNDKMLECILYKLLCFVENPADTTMLDVIDPLGCAEFVHDFSSSFHLAAVLNAIDNLPSLKSLDEARLSDGYEAQLVSQGCWEWSVYVSLCSSLSASSSYTKWKVSKAKRIILQNFTIDDPHYQRRRKFLEDKIGVPSEWLEEALALRCISDGDPFQYVQHLSKFSSSEASKVVDNIVVPNLLFMGKDDVETSLRLLEAFANAIGPLGRAMYDLFDLSNDIRLLSDANKKDLIESLPILFKSCNKIESTLAKCNSTSKLDQTTDCIGFTPNFKTVPLASMLAEATGQVTFLRLQLKALEAGMTISDKITNKKLPAQLAFLSLVEYDERCFNGMRVARACR